MKKKPNFTLFYLRLVIACAALSAASSPAGAQALTWDADGPGPEIGGTGTWNTSESNWLNGATHQLWDNDALDNATFGGTAGTVTIGTPVNVNNMNFTVGGYSLIGNNTVTLDGSNPTITTNGIIEFQSQLAGSGGFAKSGPGTLVLSGNNTGLNGPVTVTAGMLRIEHANALGTSTAGGDLTLSSNSGFYFNADYARDFTLTGGVVSVQGGNYMWSGSPTLTASTLLNLNGTSGTLSGNYGDDGAAVLSVTRNGEGRMTLSGNNTYTGATTISQGILQLGSAGALSSASNLVFNGVFGNGSIELTSASGDFNRDLGTGPGQVQWVTSGGFLSNGSNRIVNIGGRGDTLTWGSTNFFPSGGHLILGTSTQNMLDFENGIHLGGLGGLLSIIQVQGGSIDGHARINGVLSGAGGLLVFGGPIFGGTGNDMLELTRANTYSGGTLLFSSTLVVSADNNMGASTGTLTFFNGSTLVNTRSFTTTRSVSLIDPAGGTFQTDENLEVAGSISGIGSLTKTGSARLTLTGNNTYFGGTTINAGTLQIGNGGTVGSITGNVSNNGTLAFNRSDDPLYFGVISGTGALKKQGAGVLTLIGANTYTGGTTIDAGTLQIGNGGTTGSIVGSVTNNGTLAFNSPGGSILDGMISGSGVLRKQGMGLLVVTGENTYTGGTTIDAGTLQIGNGGTTGSIVGSVTNNGTLAFNRSDDIAYGGIISGTGQLLQLGAGKLALIGENTYTGSTVIGDGILQIGDGGATGSIVGDVINLGMLTFNRSNDLDYSGSVSGAGTIVKEGPGTLGLTGDSGAFLGSTFVNSGTLAVNGILGGVVNVDEDARLQGSGTIGTGSIAGTISPGNSIGTLGVSGNYTQLPGSIYEVEIDPAGSSDRIAVAGTANIQGGTISVIPAVGTYSAGTRYTILTAAGGRTGAFDALSLTRTLPFLDVVLSYDPNNAYLDANPLAFCAVTVTANQCAAGQGVESLGSGHSLYDTITGLPDRNAARRAFDSLSGELHGSAKGVMIEDSRFLREAVNDRLRQSFSWPGVPVSRASGQTLQENRATGHAFWTRAFGSFGHRSGDMNAARINRNIGGFFMGGDTLVADLLRLGIAGGYSNSSFNVNERFSTGSSDNYHVTAYGGTRWHALGLRFGGGYTWHDFETNRNILFPGFNNQVKGDYRGCTGQVFGELGYELPFKNVSLEPFVGVAYVNLATKGFQERGGIAALSSSRDNEGVTYSTVGMNAASMFSTAGGMTTRLRGSLGWRHAFDSVPTRSALAFSGGSIFGIAGTPIAKDAMIMGAGLDANVGKNAILGIAYTGQVFGNVVDNGVRANLDWRF